MLNRGSDIYRLNSRIRGVVFDGKLEVSTLEDLFEDAEDIEPTKNGRSRLHEDGEVRYWDFSEIMPEDYGFVTAKTEISHSGRWADEEGELKLRCDLVYTRPFLRLFETREFESYEGVLETGVEPDAASINEHLEPYGLSVKPY